MNTDRMYSIIVPLIHRWVASNARRRRAAFDSAPLTSGRVVVLGDSISQRGLWDGLLPDLAPLNRGIDGDTTVDVLARLDGAIRDPAAVSILIGTNDLHGPRSLRPVAGIADRLAEILDGIQRRAPGTPIIVNSVTPRTRVFSERLHALNELYRDVAAAAGADYLDLWPTLAVDDALDRRYTVDNLHLNPSGYVAWARVLHPRLRAVVNRA